MLPEGDEAVKRDILPVSWRFGRGTGALARGGALVGLAVGPRRSRGHRIRGEEGGAGRGCSADPHPCPSPIGWERGLEFGHSARQRRAGISAQGKRGSAPPWVKIPECTGALQGRSPCSARHPWQSDPVAPSPAASARQTPIGRRPCRAAEDFARTTQGGSRFAGLPWANFMSSLRDSRRRGQHWKSDGYVPHRIFSAGVTPLSSPTVSTFWHWPLHLTAPLLHDYCTDPFTLRPPSSFLRWVSPG
jgi:hypothetical protein